MNNNQGPVQNNENQSIGPIQNPTANYATGHDQHEQNLTHQFLISERQNVADQYVAEQNGRGEKATGQDATGNYASGHNATGQNASQNALGDSASGQNVTQQQNFPEQVESVTRQDVSEQVQAELVATVADHNNRLRIENDCLEQINEEIEETQELGETPGYPTLDQLLQEAEEYRESVHKIQQVIDDLSNLI